MIEPGLEVNRGKARARSSLNSKSSDEFFAGSKQAHVCQRSPTLSSLKKSQINLLSTQT